MLNPLHLGNDMFVMLDKQGREEAIPGQAGGEDDHAGEEHLVADGRLLRSDRRHRDADCRLLSSQSNPLHFFGVNHLKRLSTQTTAAVWLCMETTG